MYFDLATVYGQGDESDEETVDYSSSEDELDDGTEIIRFKPE